MNIFKKKAKPIPNPIFEMGVAPDKTGKPTLADVGITVAPVSVPMTATEVRNRMARTTFTSTGTTGAGTAWTTTSTTSPWTISITDTDGFIHPAKEQFNVYTILDGVTEGLYLRISENYYVLVSEVGQPNPSVTYHHNMTVTLVGNLLDWAMEAIDE